MTINRRSFLGALAACSSAVPVAGWVRAGFGANLLAQPRCESACAVVDLARRCKLPDSFAGYDLALRMIGADCRRATAASIPLCPLIIVPGFATGMTVAKALREAAEQGSTILIESGAAFDSGSEFEDHRRVLRSYFSIDAQRPLALWGDPKVGKAMSSLHPGHGGAPGAAPSSRNATLPYIDFVWPHAAKIRDFSRAVPVSSGRAELVAVAPGGIPVAIRKRLGGGTVIFLGSPAGPSMLAGDREAREWLAAVISQRSTAS